MSKRKEKILGELGFTYAGLSGKTQKDFGKGKPFIPFMNIMTNGKIDPKFMGLVEVAPNERQNAVQIGDLFFTTSSETPEEVGMTSVLLDDIGECYLNSFCFGFRLFNFDDLLPEYAPYLFRGNAVRKQIINLGQGYTRFNLPKTELLKKLNLELPSEPEQRKISKILTKADSIIEKTQAVIVKYKAIKQGMLQDLFTRGIDLKTGKLRPRYEDAPDLYKESKLGWIPREWNVVEFGNEIELMHGYAFSNSEFTEYGIPVIKISQVKPDGIDLLGCSYVAERLYEAVKEFIVKNGDVLMALTGATLGKASLVKDLSGIAYQNQRVGRFEPIGEENVDKTYLYYLLIAGELLTQIFSKVNIGAQGNIGKTEMYKATFKKPLFEEQKIIAERLTTIDNKLQAEQTYLQKMHSLKKGLMEDLLSGRKQVKILRKEGGIYA